jgi:hypothetical protein
MVNIKSMKKFILLFGIVLLSMTINAQLFVIIEPQYFRPGILYNHNFETFGLYGYSWYGNISEENGEYKFYAQNIKMGLGISFFTEESINFYLGINHNYFFDYTKQSPIANIDNIIKTCFDVGMSGKVSSRVTFLFLIDMWNWESSIGINYKFGKHDGK